MNKQPKIKKWNCIDSRIIFEHPRLTLIEDQVQLPEGKTVPYLKFGKNGNAITILCINDDKILLQQEYSYPPDEILYQFPGGKLEKDESSIQAANRELAEESGYTIENYEELGWYYLNNRRSDSKMFVVLANDVKKSVQIKGDLEERIISEWIPISKLKEMIIRGEIVNFSVLAAWALFLSKKNHQTKPTFI